MLRFGTGGIPHSSKERTIFSGIKQIHELGLGSIELEFVYQTWLKKEDAGRVKELANKLDVALTSHGSYYINLNAEENQKKYASINRIVTAAEVCEIAGVKSLTFHPAYYLKQNPKVVYENVREVLKKLEKELANKNIQNLKLALETTGKQSQFGTVAEIVNLSKEFDFITPCIDFSHIYARSLGKVNTTAQFQEIINEIKDGLGKKGLSALHMHMSGIVFGKTGERNHLNLEESDFNYKAVLEVLKNSKVSGFVTCESPSLEKDALLMKQYYASI